MDNKANSSHLGKTDAVWELSSEPFEAESCSRGYNDRIDLLDRYLPLLLVISAAMGLSLGLAFPTKDDLDIGKPHGGSTSHSIGLLLMMFLPFSKVEYERIPSLIRSPRFMRDVTISLILNWIVGPCLMLALSWVTLNDLPSYRAGVIMVGISRCIAMLITWNDIAEGSSEYSTLLVVINTAMQLAGTSVYSNLLVDGTFGNATFTIHIQFDDITVSTLYYLGIPFVLGLLVRYTSLSIWNKKIFDQMICPLLLPISVMALLYTTMAIFSHQSYNIIHNIDPIIRVIISNALCIVTMWALTFFLCYRLALWETSGNKLHGYKMAVTHAFASAGNNFTLAMALSISIYGLKSDEALAAAICAITGVPILLALSWFGLYLKANLTENSPRVEPAVLLQK